MAVYSNINPNFPVEGISQNSSGFRDNFAAAKQEIENIQSKTIQLTGIIVSDPVEIGSGNDNLIINTMVAGESVTSGTWAPGFQFATSGDSVITITSSTAIYVKTIYSDFILVWVAMNLKFSTNAYTTAAGAAYITGLPFTSISAANNIGMFNLIDNNGRLRLPAGCTQFAAQSEAAGSRITLLGIGSDENLPITVSEVLPSLNYDVSLQGTYRIAV